MKVSTELIPAASLNLNEVTIDARGLYKHYGKIIAIRGINLQIRRGELFGLIGTDGAGKTSTFNILGGVMEATAGEPARCGGSPRCSDWRTQRVGNYFLCLHCGLV